MMNALTILGILIGLFFGIFAIWSHIKTNKKASLCFEQKACYSLFKTDVKRLNIAINYRNKSVDNPMILFRGAIKNNGKTDIDNTQIHSPLKINAIGIYQWLEAKISKKPGDAFVSLDVAKNQTLELKWDLLKAGEEIEFESLIAIPDGTATEGIRDEFYQSVYFDFRITNINRIEKPTHLGKDDRLGSIFTIIYAAILILIGVSRFLPYYVPYVSSPLSIEYRIYNNNETFDSNIRSYKEQKIVIEKNGAKIEQDIISFNKEYDLEIKAVQRGRSLKIFAIMMVSTGGLLMTSIVAKEISQWIRKKKRQSVQRYASESTDGTV